MAKQLGFLFDVNRCVGCRSCEMACKNEHQTAFKIRWRRVSQTSADSFLSISCNHCESPECFRVCPNRAYTKRRDGIVVINSDRCDGCQACIKACPYKAPQFDLELRKVSKCDMCLSRQVKGLLPACLNACHTGALSMLNFSGDLKDGLVKTLPDFPDYRMTRPSIRFYPQKDKKRYWLKN